MFQNKDPLTTKAKSTIKKDFPITPSFALPSRLTTAKGKATRFLSELEELVQVQDGALPLEFGSISNPVQI